MKTILLTGYLLCFFLQIFGQNSLHDWQQKLKLAKHDTTRLSCYGRILETPLHEDTVLIYLKKAATISKKYPEHPTNINILIRYGNLYRAKNMPDSTKYFYDKAFALSLKIQNNRYIKLADFYQTYTIKSLANKINHLYKILDKYQYDNANVFDKSLQYQIYNYMTHCYLTYGNIAKAKRIIATAKPYIITLQDSVKYYNVFTRIVALDIDNISKSGKSEPKFVFSDNFRDIYSELYSFTERNNLPNLRVEPLNSFGKILFYEKKYKEAINKAQELLNHAKKYKYPHAMNLSYMLFAESYFELGYYQKALSFAQKTESNAKVLNYKRLTLFSKIYRALGNDKKAYLYLLDANKEEERVKGVNEQLQSAEIENQLELTKKQEQLAAQELASKLKEERIKIEKRQKYLFVGLLMVSLGLLAWSLWNYIKQRQMRQLLELQAQELLDANETKDKIFAVLGHDLQSPISDLKAITMLFQSNDITTFEVQELIAPLTLKIESLQEMMHNLLQWSLFELEQQVHNCQLVDLSYIIGSVIRQIQPSADNKEIAIFFQHQKVEIIANANELEIVFRNVLSNSVKFTPIRGCIAVNIFKESESVKIEIKDSGIGLPIEIQKNLFVFPVSRKGTANEKGLGLGLKIVRELTSKNGGFFSINCNNSDEYSTIASFIFLCNKEQDK